jgi:hypothetical protein
MKALETVNKKETAPTYNRTKSVHDSVGYKHKTEPDFVGSGYHPPERFVPLLAKLSHPINATQRARLFAQLQRHYGNRYVQRVVSAYRSQNGKEDRRSFASKILSKRGSGRPLDGNHAVQRLFTFGVIQEKLKIGQPNDIYEQEADRVAEQVMRMPENTAISGQPSIVSKGDESVQTKPTTSGCPSCEEELIQPRPLPIRIIPLVQRQPRLAGQASEVAPDIEARINTLKGVGQPLPEADRIFMERRFGVDFSNVRVHADSNAIQMNRELNAQAFTYGRDVYFGTGRYSPETSSGRKLLAHELMHVMQQGQSGYNIHIQRACGQALIAASVGTRSGCTDLFDGTFVSGSLFRFKKSCDEFIPGQSAALIGFSSGLPATATLEIHGFASVDGRPLAFNQNLGCARALAVRKLLTDPRPLGAGIAASRITGIVNHGPVPGPVADRRSVVIRTTTPTPPPPTPYT